MVVQYVLDSCSQRNDGHSALFGFQVTESHTFLFVFQSRICFDLPAASLREWAQRINCFEVWSCPHFTVRREDPDGGGCFFLACGELGEGDGGKVGRIIPGLSCTFVFSKDQLALTSFTFDAGMPTMAQQTLMTVDERFLTSCVWARFLDRFSHYALRAFPVRLCWNHVSLTLPSGKMMTWKNTYKNVHWSFLKEMWNKKNKKTTKKTD